MICNVIFWVLFQVLYCDACRELCHPKRGPLAAHNLGPPRGSWQTNGCKSMRGYDANSNCDEHTSESVSLYCAQCKKAACSLCQRDRHAAHQQDVLPLAAACKAQKVLLLSYYLTLSQLSKPHLLFIQFIIFCSTYID